jgi:predicted phage replisome organizer
MSAIHDDNSSSGIILDTVKRDGKYYWVKLKTSFFDSQDIRMIEGRENGEKYIVFWLKILLLAVDQEEIGVLRYKEAIPYDAKMLADITNTDFDIVKSAMDLFQQIGMIEVTKNGDIWIEAITGIVGSVTDSAIRMRRFRAKKKNLIAESNNITQIEEASQSDVDIEKEIEIEKETEKEKELSAIAEVAKATPKDLEKEKQRQQQNLKTYLKEQQIPEV